MSVQLSSLRVTVEGDSSSYVTAANAVAKANEQMAASGVAAGAQLAQQDVAAGNAGAALTRLSRANVDGYASSSQFYRGIASLQTQMELGNVTTARASTTYAGLVNRFGMVADATAIAGKGNKDFAAVVDGVNQKVGLQAVALDKARGAVSPMTAALGGLQMQMVMMAAGAGPVAVFLSALGPWGIAAAVGVGLVSAALAEAQRTTQLLAAESVNLEKFKETTGLSTDALQALTQAAARHGVQADQTMAAIVRFTTSWEQARLGGGAFLTQLQKIDPGLSAQMQRTKDVSTAIDLYVLAIQKADAAGDIAARNQLMRAGGGRGGVAAFTGVASAITDAGGLAGLTQNAVDAGKAINDKLLNEIQILKAQLDETTKHADLMMGSIGAKPILETGLAWQKMREQVAGVLSDIANGTSTLSPWSAFLFRLSNYAMGPDTTAKVFGVQASGGMGQPSLNQMPAYPPTLDMTGIPTPIPQKDIKAQLADMKEYVTLLGSGATESDKLKLKLMELQANVDGNATAENKYAAAIGKSAAELDAYIAVINLHNAALGAGATVTDTVTAKMATLAKQQQQGAGLTNDQVANSKRLIQAQADGTFALQGNINAINVQTQSFNMGIGPAETFRVIQTKINENLNAGKPAMDGVSAAFLTMAGNAGAAAQNLEKIKIDSSIRFGAQTAFLTPEDVQIAQQLKGYFNNDIPAALASSQAAAMRLNKTFSDLGTLGRDSLSGFAVDFKNQLTSGAGAWKSFEAAGASALNKISDKLMSMAIDGLWSKAFGGSSGGILSLLGLGLGGGTGVGGSSVTGSAVGKVGMANGGVMTSSGSLPLNRYAGGGVANSPQMTIFGEGRTPEAYVPLPDGRSIPVNINVPTSVAGGGGPVTNISPVYNIDARGSNMTEAQFQAILAKNNAQLAKDINNSLPDRVAAINRDPRRR